MSQPTRRDVLKMAGAAAAGAVLARGDFAASADAAGEPFRFALVTDTHFGRTGETEVGRLRATVEEINASGAELTIFCGDLVNGGASPANRRWYPVWKEVASGLRRPWYAVPGNHDPDEVFLAHVADATDFVVDRAPFRFVCFRDAIRGSSHDGVVTREQVGWIGSRIAEGRAKGLRSVLVTHIPHHDNAKPDRGWRITEGRELFARMLADHAADVVAIFSGHMHNGLRGWDDNHAIQEVVLPSLSWNDDARLHAAPGYCLSDMRPGYVTVEASADAMLLTYKPVGAEATETKRLALKEPRG